MRKWFLASIIVLIFIITVSACVTKSTIDLAVAFEPGQLVEGEDEFGIFYTYVPANIPENAEILVVVYGTPLKDHTEEWNAEYYASNWIDFAEANNLVLIVPLSNQQDFSSRLGDHALGGYRGLFGREIGADEWLLRLVKGHRQKLGLADEPFYL